MTAVGNFFIEQSIPLDIIGDVRPSSATSTPSSLW